jgi:hypothetical protein
VIEKARLSADTVGCNTGFRLMTRVVRHDYVMECVSRNNSGSVTVDISPRELQIGRGQYRLVRSFRTH